MTFNYIWKNLQIYVSKFIFLQNHRIAWVGGDLQDHLVPNSLPWTGTLPTRPGSSGLYPIWPSTLSGMGHPRFSGQPVSVSIFFFFKVLYSSSQPSLSDFHVSALVYLLHFQMVNLHILFMLSLLLGKCFL